MHEYALTQAILESATQEAKRQEAQAVHKLTLRIGALAGIVEECLVFAFESLRSEYPLLAPDAQLEVEHVPARYFCATCQEPFEPQIPIARCPRCGTASAELIAGRELEIASIEVS